MLLVGARSFCLLFIFFLILDFSASANAVSFGLSSSGNVYIAIDDNANHYVITPAQIGAKVILKVKYVGVSSNLNWETGFLQQVYHFQFVTPQGNLKVNIWEHDNKITIEHDALVDFKKIPFNSFEFHRSY